MIYLLSLISTFLFVVYSKWQFSDDRGETSGKWHPWGLMLRGSIPVSCFIMQHFPAPWQSYLLACALCGLAWEIGINIIALKQPWNYVGKTSKIDIATRKYHWILFFGFVGVALLIKIFVK